MAVRAVLRMGDSRLLQRSAEVQTFAGVALEDLLEDMLDTMQACDGAGLAAPQIGVMQRVVIFGSEHNPRYPDAGAVPRTVLINPLITPLGSETALGWEGCLSVPGMRGLVPRYTRIRYSGLNERGEQIERTAEGFHARVVQHECDHLDGILYPMRIPDLRYFGFIDELFAPGSIANPDSL